MKEHTKEVINLCKQVAEKHRKMIREGDWFICDKIDSRPLLFDNDNFQYTENYEISDVLGFYKEWFPLWTISGCLDWLQEKTKELGDERMDLYLREEKWHCYPWVESAKKTAWHKEGKTLLEALLKAVLFVLGEKK